MIADLLDGREHRQDPPPTLHPLLESDDVTKPLVDGRLIERRLLARERTEARELDLIGQIGRDRRVDLHAAQHERRGDLAQEIRRRLVPVALDRHRELPLEGALSPEQPRVEKINDRPELGEAILDRCARQRHAPPRDELPHGLTLRGLGVLDVLRLVEHDAVERDQLQELAVAPPERIGGQQRAGLRLATFARIEPFVQRLQRARAPRPVVHDDVQPRIETPDLAPPIAEHTRRTHDQETRRRPPRRGRCLRQIRAQRQHLHRLAETHVVGKTRPEAELGNRHEPRESTLLVGPQIGDQRGRRRPILGARLDPVLEREQRPLHVALAHHLGDRLGPLGHRHLARQRQP